MCGHAYTQLWFLNFYRMMLSYLNLCVPTALHAVDSSHHVIWMTVQICFCSLNTCSYLLSNLKDQNWLLYMQKTFFFCTWVVYMKITLNNAI